MSIYTYEGGSHERTIYSRALFLTYSWPVLCNLTKCPTPASPNIYQLFLVPTTAPPPRCPTPASPNTTTLPNHYSYYTTAPPPRCRTPASPGLRSACVTMRCPSPTLAWPSRVWVHPTRTTSPSRSLAASLARGMLGSSTPTTARLTSSARSSSMSCAQYSVGYSGFLLVSG